MFFLEFLGYIKDFSIIENVGFDDVVDRMNYQGTVIILCLLSTLVTVKQYFLSPINCYQSTSMGGHGVEDYISNMCWTEGLYPVNKSIIWSKQNPEWDKLQNQHLSYYQWVPMILGLQAMLFMIPWIVWQMINLTLSGFNFSDLLCRARSAHLMISDARNVQVTQIANQLLTALNLKNRSKRRFLFGGYMLIKLMYAAMNILQIYWILHFLRLGKGGYKFSWSQLIISIAHGRIWPETAVFPRSGMCRHRYENLGAYNYVLAQCSLPINMINEKIFVALLLYLWIGFLLTLSSVVWHLLQFRQRHYSVATHKQHLLQLSDPGEANFGYFVSDILGADGCFLWHFLRSNAGSLMADDVLMAAYKLYTTQQMT